jgi:hypothetical protein
MAFSDLSDFLAIFRLRKMIYRILINSGIWKSAIGSDNLYIKRCHSA